MLRKMRVAVGIAAVASFAFALNVAACGSTSDADNGGDSGSIDDGGVRSDASSPNDASSSDDAPPFIDGSIPLDASSIAVDDGGFFNSDFAVSILGSVVGTGADFFAPAAAADTCPIVTAGDCILFDCAVGQTHGPATDSENPGTLTVAGGAPNELVTLTLQDDHSYEGFASGASTFAAGTMITFNATGDAAPAFTQTLVLPSLPTLSSPMIDGGNVVIDRAANFSVAWSGGNADVVGVTILPNGSRKQIACEFPASAAAAVVPSALLTHLKAGAAQITFLAYAKTITSEGAFVVRFQAGMLLDSGAATATLE